MKIILISLAVSVIMGIIIGLLGLRSGSSIPDEHAGEAAILLGIIGFAVGFIVSFIVTYLILK
jgi:xanthosine utilization system XapX-like protein